MTVALDRPRAARPRPRTRPVVRDRAIRRYQPAEPMPSARRFVALAMVLLMVMTIVVAKLVYVQAVQHSRFEALAVDQIRHRIPLAATRGSILDRNGDDLAMSVDKTTIYADPSLIQDPLGAAKALAAVLNQPVAAIQALLTKPGRFVYLARKVDDATAQHVKDLHLPGVAQTHEAARLRTSGDLASPLIGTVGLDNNGLGGIELQYESTLAGKPGSIIVDADRHMRQIASGEKKVTPSVPGNDLVLTIDRGIQYQAEHLLSDEITAAHAKGGVALVMNTQTGDILAMADLHADKPGGPVVEAPRNSAVTDAYEPGSVNKLITIAGALEQGAIKVDDRFSVPDHMKVGNHDFSDHDPHPVENWGPTDIMRESSNIGTIMIANRLGAQHLGDYLSDFGFGVKPGTGLPGETSGILRPVSTWYSTDMGSIPIGQGVSVSALQMLAAYNAVANGGMYVSPRLVRATIDGNGVNHDAPAAKTRRAVSGATASAVTAMLEEVVKSGTGTLAQIPGYPVAGKTGTARKPAPGGKGYIQGAYMSSFAGFAPADHPVVSALVMLDEPTPIYGGLVAAPVFSELVRAVLRQLRIAPSSTADASAPAPTVATAQVTQGDGDVPAGSAATGATSTTVAPCCSHP